MRSFKEYVKLITEAKMLDISILAAKKVLKNDAAIDEFLTSNVLVEEKTDGVKITAIKRASNGNLSDWVISYKGNMFFDDEFNYIDDKDIKKYSIGTAQYKFVLDHFKTIAKKAKSIPEGTELFIEYLMNKPTLSSNYTQAHGMILIGHSKSKYKIKNGKLITSPSGFFTDKRNKYATVLDLDVPAVLFNGKFTNETTFKNGIEDPRLLAEYEKIKNTFEWDIKKILVNNIGELLINVESIYGGKAEGVVCKYKDKIIKFQQTYQLDQEARKLIKMQWIDDNPETENKYWKDVRNYALEILREIDPADPIEYSIKEISNQIKSNPPKIEHSKKTIFNTLDDIQLTAKSILLRRLPGNNNALYFGKFRILTKAHAGIIKDALKKYDGVKVALITGKDTQFSKDIRMKQLKHVFGNKIEIAESTSGNIITLINKFDDNINIVLAGSDRVDAYKEQMKRSPDIHIVEIPRTDEDISATKIIANIENEDYFKANTDPDLWPMYNELKEFYTTEG